MRTQSEQTGGRRLWTLLALSLVAVAVVMAASPNQASAIGMLIPSDQNLPPLAVKSHRVNIDITDQAAVTKIEQVFVNHTNRQLEATFYFPVPKGATVSDFSLWINGRKTKGAVLEKNKARQIYEGIVRRTEDPGLIEYMDGTVFQARIFPVPANGEQKLEIAFAQVLDKSGSIRRLLYPLKTGRKAARLMQDFTLVANIDSRAPIKTVYSPSHKIAVSRKSDHEVQVSFEENAADLERDFLLYMSTSDDDIGMTVLSFDEDGKNGEDGYFMMVLTPKIEVDEEKMPGKTVSFVVDTSGSMAGEKMEQARGALKYCINKLRPQDSFNVIRFSTDVESLFANPVEASKDNKRRGLEFADQLEAAGGTAIDEALAQAMRAKVGASAAHMVIFMTDGRPTVGSTDINEIVGNVKKGNQGGAKIFTFGVGFEVNTHLLDAIARDHHGAADYIRPSEDIEVKVSALYNKIAYPMMTDISIDYGGARVYDVYPRQMPDLFRGGQVVVMGRNRSALPSALKVSGQIGQRAVTMTFGEEDGDPLAEEGSKAHDFIPKIWATRKVGYLLEQIRIQGELSELRDEVIRLARKYGLVTPYTSYLAVDDSELENRPPVDRRPPPRVRAQEFDGDMGGGGMAPRAEPAPAAKPGRAANQARREKAMAKKDAFAADSGEEAVESSLGTERYKRADSADDAASVRTRYIDNRLFVYQGGIWRQDGVEGQASIKIKYLSEAYFSLLKARPELRAYLALGQRVVLKVGKKTVEVGPDGVDSLSEAKIRAW
mgnify:CR=1 FL=1